jgi:hypothetical protein
MVVDISLEAYIFNPLENLTSSQVALCLGGKLFLKLEILGLNCGTSIQASSPSGQSNLGPRTWIQSPGLGQPVLQRYVRLVTQECQASAAQA